MGFFHKKETHGFLGVDIGTSGIKLVELAPHKDRPVVLTYGFTQWHTGQEPFSFLDDPVRAGKLLQDLHKQTGATSRKAMASLPLSTVFSGIIAVPNMKTEREMRSLIDAQVAKLTPIPLSDMSIDPTYIDGKPWEGSSPKLKERGFSRVLVTGASRTQLQKYIDLFKAAQIELPAIDTESFALIRSLVGKDPGASLLMDIGSMRTNFTIVENGTPFLTRSVNIGGHLITRQIMDQMHVNQDDAERMKMDLSSFTGESVLPGGLPPVLEALMQPLTHEIRYAMQLYANMDLRESERIERVVVTGGSSLLPRIPQYLSEVLNMNVYHGDPWARTLYPEALRPVLDEIGPRMAVAIGLALREFSS